jgi:phage shock protein PspC (stress-responsive transcriptional regulator)
MKAQRLYRSTTNKVIAGVCGGYAEYFDVDPVIIRVLFVLLTIFGGSGILIYIASIFIIPKKTVYEGQVQSEQTSAANSPSALRYLFGIVLVVVGIFVLIENLGLFSLSDFLDNSLDYIFPILLIIAGMAIIYYRQSAVEQKTPSSASSENQPEDSPKESRYHQLRRSTKDKKIAGVCGGLAQYFDIDSSIIRILYVILCLASFGAGVLLYIILALVVPNDRTFQSETR